jgi:hypothetical protein
VGKNIIFIIIFILLAGGIFAEIHGDVSISNDLNDDAYKARIEISNEIPAGVVKIIPYFVYTNYFATTEKWDSNKPFIDIYEVGVELDVKIFYIKLNHACGHEVISYNGYNMAKLEQGLLTNNTCSFLTAGVRW